MVNSNVERVCAAAEVENDGGNERELVEAEIGVHIVRQRHVVGPLVSVRLVAEVNGRSVVDVGRGVNSLHKLALLLIPMEGCPEGSVTIDSLLEGLGHPIEVNGGLGIHGDEIAFMGVPLSSTEALHRLVDDDDVSSLGVVMLKLERMSKITK